MLDRNNEILPDDVPVIPKKAYTVHPRHRVILSQMKEGIPLRQAMATVGYSGRSLDCPKQTLNKTRSWKALMDEYVPEEVLATRHNEILNLRAQQPVKNLAGDVIELKDVPDAKHVLTALEMGYKLRGAYKEAAAPAKSQTIYNLFYKPEVRAQVKAFEEGLKQQMINEASNTRNANEDSEDYRPEIIDV